MKYKRHFERDICRGIQMVFVPSNKAEGWRTSTEEEVKESLRSWTRRHDLDEVGTEERRHRETTEKEDAKRRVDIIGVFAIP
jgi:phage baseplate assembly protein W